MPNVPKFTLPPLLELALFHAPSRHRGTAAASFALDARLAQFLGQSSDPLVTQLRLAWWREQLAKPYDERARGDAILDAIGFCWGTQGGTLIGLVDGWERLLEDSPIGQEAVEEFAEGRARMFSGLASLAGRDDAVDDAGRAGRVWALADLAAHSTLDKERSAIVALAAVDIARKLCLPRELKHLTILGELGRKAIAAGGSALMARRRDALTVMRLGMFGR